MIQNELNTFWQNIDHVFLDMDGTLLDKHFDDYFWEHFVPERFAEKEGISVIQARKLLLQKYKNCEGTLAWTDLDFWSTELDLDIPALKIKVDHLICVHPYVIDFMLFCRKVGKTVTMVTNAHSKTLAIKMNKTALSGYFDQIICSQEVGLAKEDPLFWKLLHKHVVYDPARTLLADDTEKVLISAEIYGIISLIYVARPSSKSLPKKSKRFKSIIFFNELIPE
ncbi:MAG: HAD hydrolase-like protein [Proteobacteria bacterium]|nr:HAD hydrolase-like protein [Pseudomonadota bacterium]MBU1737490.1 HAD hydrolase-like protein [Pseudomonadota bacterium]